MEILMLAFNTEEVYILFYAESRRVTCVLHTPYFLWAPSDQSLFFLPRCCDALVRDTALQMATARLVP